MLRRRSRCGAATAIPAVSRVSTASGSTPVPQSTAAAGSPAPRVATRTIQATHQAAGVPARWPSGVQSRPRSPPARPRTVAGPTTGATRRLAPTATRLTWPEIAATSGVQASWAAAGTATASASQRGSQRASASRQPGASSRIPPVASTESAKPTEVASPGSTSRSTTSATPRARLPRCRPLEPRASRPTPPMAAARSTLGSVRASSTNPAMPEDPDGVEPAAAHPQPPGHHQQEAHHQGQVGAGDGQQVRQAGGAEVVREGRVEPAVVTVDQRGHQRPLLGRATRHRGPDRGPQRTGGPPPHVRAGQGLRRPGRHQDRGHVGSARRHQPPRRPHGGAERHVAPRVVRGEDEHRGGQGVRRAATGHPAYLEADQHLLAELPGAHAWVRRDRALDGRDRTLGGEAGHRVVGHLRLAHHAHPGHGRQDQEDPGRGQPPAWSEPPPGAEQGGEERQAQGHRHGDGHPASHQAADPGGGAERRHPQVRDLPGRGLRPHVRRSRTARAGSASRRRCRPPRAARRPR